MISLKDITAEYIKRLVNNRTPENDSLDYKKTLSLDSNKEKRNFLEDVCAMANANGGIILIGVEEGKRGHQGKICGVDISEFDQDYLDRINQIICSGLEPTYNGFSYQDITIDKKTVYVFRMGKSWHAPHRLTVKQHREFYTRRNASSAMMTINEIRHSFLQRYLFVQYAKDFVEERVKNITENYAHENIILHIIPEMAFTEGYLVNIEKYIQDTENFLFLKDFPPIFHAGRNRDSDQVINFDGMQSKTLVLSNNKKLSYTQLYRNGIIEAVESFFLNQCSQQGKIRVYSHQLIEDEVSKKTLKYLSSASENDGFLPCYIIFTLTGVKDFIIPPEGGGRISRDYLNNKIDRNILQTTPVKISNNSRAEIKQALKSTYDMIWNAANWPETVNEILLN